jgi:hypothetical protein
MLIENCDKFEGPMGDLLLTQREGGQIKNPKQVPTSKAKSAKRRE